MIDWGCFAEASPAKLFLADHHDNDDDEGFLMLFMMMMFMRMMINDDDDDDDNDGNSDGVFKGRIFLADAGDWNCFVEMIMTIMIVD